MARFEITQWNAERILGRAPAVLEAYGAVIGEELKQQIATVQFDWPTGTLRFVSLYQSGRRTKKGVYIEKGLRDAVDTGDLQKSQTAPQVSTNGALSVMTIAWTAPYSGLVLHGGTYPGYTNPNGTDIGPRQRPGRDWITPALKAQPFRPFFVTRWRQLAGA